MEGEDLATARIKYQKNQENLNEAKSKALAEKKAGNIQEALDHLKRYKIYEKISKDLLDKFPALKSDEVPQSPLVLENSI